MRNHPTHHVANTLSRTPGEGAGTTASMGIQDEESSGGHRKASMCDTLALAAPGARLVDVPTL